MGTLGCWDEDELQMGVLWNIFYPMTWPTETHGICPVPIPQRCLEHDTPQGTPGSPLVKKIIGFSNASGWRVKLGPGWKSVTRTASDASPTSSSITGADGGPGAWWSPSDPWKTSPLIGQNWFGIVIHRHTHSLNQWDGKTHETKGGSFHGLTWEDGLVDLHPNSWWVQESNHEHTWTYIHVS